MSQGTMRRAIALAVASTLAVPSAAAAVATDVHVTNTTADPVLSKVVAPVSVATSQSSPLVARTTYPVTAGFTLSAISPGGFTKCVDYNKPANVTWVLDTAAASTPSSKVAVVVQALPSDTSLMTSSSLSAWVPLTLVRNTPIYQGSVAPNIVVNRNVPGVTICATNSDTAPKTVNGWITGHTEPGA